MRISHNNVICSLSVLGCLLASMGTFQHSSHQAFAAPIRHPLSTTISNDRLTAPDLTHFPYTVTGAVPPSLYHPGQVLDSCIQPNSYAISFDDGPGQLTDELLDYLDEQNIKVTFFMNGDNWNCIYRYESQRLLKRAFNAQHQIAAHPWSHRDFQTLTDGEIREEMHKIEDAFREILGVVPRYMRPPYGEHSKRVRKIMEEMGYLMILWDVDQLDEHVDDDDIYSDDNYEYENERHEHGEEEEEDEGIHINSSHGQTTMASTPSSTHRHRVQSSFSSKWAEAVRGVPHMALDRDTMMMGGIYQEATSTWAVEYVQNLGYNIMPVGACMGETDPRLWYKEIVKPAEEGSIPETCYIP
ncbi:Carbohydrate esterase 4 protein [Lobosporangium transversale]|uniref:NodB homology domain-containing protein n=1 Tax=Lobosporangium transversale TaxID=64571 RepID=A0A1Y2G6W2_9FUNG|nr:hypothetical protein BCR41DRAFT_365385 [Lobosporangium transversale]KAF9898201.1 Carbohydrate esterase 4 protein [Lobosporangium transversale]ORY94311.1 hypothetical protein BCR41DRAFT_365385 [Lobosporangium transversale]|eukprot:XP_021875254.1 hypothetical protein BCR41DRAFT_365385 [Lobosporangium transversale]